MSQSAASMAPELTCAEVNAFDLPTDILSAGSAPSWDNSYDVLEGFEQFMDTTPNVPAASFAAQGFGPVVGSDTAGDSSFVAPPQPLRSHETTKRNNRIAQKRFRERRKVKSQTLENEFAETKAQLEELKDRQKQLEARNVLLEKVMKLNKQPQHELSSTHKALQDIWREHGLESDPLLARLSQIPSLTLTIWDSGPTSVPCQDLGNMTLTEFAELYSEYVRKLGICLVELEEDGNQLAKQSLERWITEINSIFALTCLCKQSGLASYRFSKMDEPRSLPDTEPDDALYHGVMKAMHHTEEQVVDLMHVRRLFCAQMGQLARDREALLNKMLNVNRVDVNVLNYANDRLAQLTDLTKQLQKKAAVEFQMYLQQAAAFYRGIQTSRQLAAAMVHSYPIMPSYHMLERLAKERGEPSMQELADDTSIDGLQHAANWEQVVTYLKTITMDNLHEYVPVLDRSS